MQRESEGVAVLIATFNTRDAVASFGQRGSVFGLAMYSASFQGEIGGTIQPASRVTRMGQASERRRDSQTRAKIARAAQTTWPG